MGGQSEARPAPPCAQAGGVRPVYAARPDRSRQEPDLRPVARASRFSASTAPTRPNSVPVLRQFTTSGYGIRQLVQGLREPGPQGRPAAHREERPDAPPPMVYGAVYREDNHELAVKAHRRARAPVLRFRATQPTPKSRTYSRPPATLLPTRTLVENIARSDASARIAQGFGDNLLLGGPHPLPRAFDVPAHRAFRGFAVPAPTNALMMSAVLAHGPRPSRWCRSPGTTDRRANEQDQPQFRGRPTKITGLAALSTTAW